MAEMIHHSRTESNGSLLARRAARQTLSNDIYPEGQSGATVVPLPPPVLSIAVDRSPAEVSAGSSFPVDPPTVARDATNPAGRPPRSPVPRLRPEPIQLPALPPPDDPPPPPPYTHGEASAVVPSHARTDTLVYNDLGGEHVAPRPPRTPPPSDAIAAPTAEWGPAAGAAPTTADADAAPPSRVNARPSVTFSPQLPHPRSSLAPVSAFRDEGAPPTSPVIFRTIATQTAPLNDGFIMRRGTQPILPILLIITAPIVLLISGVSYGHYWRLVYATVAPDDTPIAMNAYVACLFCGLVAVNCLVFPMCVKILSSGLSTRSQNRHLLGASVVFSGVVCFPLGACELSLLNDSRANASVLGLSAQEASSTVTLILLITMGVFYIWMAYTHYVVNWLQGVMRRRAMKILRNEGVAVLHQRPGTTTTSVTKLAMAQSSVKRSKRDAQDQFDAIEMDTVSRRVVFSPD